MDIGETILVETAAQWRRWLNRNAATKREIWLVNYKKGSGKRSLDYETALDEATCFGWVDVLVKGVDAEQYVMRWVPRRSRGNWTERNRERARQLLSEGRMTAAGMASLPPDLKPDAASPAPSGRPSR
jgi:uncharacterized protein YdeI (YjbR/CyaY-like superfamily)